MRHAASEAGVTDADDACVDATDAAVTDAAEVLMLMDELGREADELVGHLQVCLCLSWEFTRSKKVVRLL